MMAQAAYFTVYSLISRQDMETLRHSFLDHFDLFLLSASVYRSSLVQFP